MYEHDSPFGPPVQSGLLPGVAQMAPDSALGNVVAAIDSPSLSRYDRVQLICAYQRLIAHYQAGFYQEIARLWDQEQEDHPDSSLEDSAWAVKTELGAALRLSNRSAQLTFDFALLLARSARVWAALSEGKIDHYRAEVMVANTCHLPDADLAWVVSQVIEEAEGLTAGQIRVRVQRLCYLTNPEEAKVRYGEALKGRFVQVTGNEFGTATLEGSDLPPDRAEAAYRRLTRLARKLKRKGEERTMDQLRADLLLGLLLGERESQASDPKGGSVDLRVDLETLAGLSEAPGELSGFGPVIADIARQVATEQRHCQWTWAVTDPETGLALHNGITRRRPRPETRSRRAEPQLHISWLSNAFPPMRSRPSAALVGQRTDL